MKTIALTQGKSALVDDEDFPVVSQHKWCAHKKKGYIFYAVRRSGKKFVYLHNQIMGGLRVDHVNGDGLDNRRCNLRFASHPENCRNHRIHSTNTSGQSGISRDKKSGKWRTYIKFKNRLIALFRFDELSDAINRRREAEKNYFGEFARS